jgi:1,4-alpha-glucan branching enzyme
MKKKALKLSVVALLATLCWQCRTTNEEEQDSAVKQSGSDGLNFYEATRIRGMQPTKDCSQFRPQTGLFPIERNQQGHATKIQVRVLSDNPGNKISIIGKFNNWGQSFDPEHHLKPVPNTPYFQTVISGLRHTDEYRFLVNGKQLLDPSAVLFSSAGFYRDQGLPSNPPYLNSVYWDLQNPNSFKLKAKAVDLREEPLVIGEAEVFSLAQKWQGGPKNQHDTYRFIATSGILKHLKSMGYNGIEFLPFNASVDGDHWHYRYQVFGLFAPESRYGNPDEFKMMMEAFNRAGIAVIMDAVVGHYPFQANQGVRTLNQIGPHMWTKQNGKPLYGNHPSPWKTHRYDYANPYIRRFLTDSIIHMMCTYRISGIRFDNLDGIKDYNGPGGGGPDFLHLLVGELRDYIPESILIGEMFFGNNAVMKRRDFGGFGLNFRTHSDFFDFLKDNMQGQTEHMNIGKLRDAIRKPWDWREAPRVQYVTNHDEAANGRGGATGFYPATLLRGGSWFHAEKKTIAFGSVTMLSGTAYLDMPQMRLLQEGSFNSNAAVDWSLTKHDSQRKVFNYFAALSNYYKSNPAFAFKNYHPNIENHTDAANGHRVISLYRFDRQTNKQIYALINLGHQSYTNYSFGVHQQGPYKIVLNSDAAQYGGSGKLESLGINGVQTFGPGSHGKPLSVQIPWLGPYSTVIIEK